MIVVLRLSGNTLHVLNEIKIPCIAERLNNHEQIPQWAKRLWIKNKKFWASLASYITFILVNKSLYYIAFFGVVAKRKHLYEATQFGHFGDFVNDPVWYRCAFRWAGVFIQQ